ncbi:hypothetical protein MPL3356_400100 [Mesorhizobium plurifarium]|uniref:Uncharacterized protein n=1 Tax=Mesorhizobium plurifarium TaxID=69974 RepID=A0A090G0A7_MESPL|nr:hypothetical protein MPL3356_400100 [Mesorhizobium plurifarium]
MAGGKGLIAPNFSGGGIENEVSALHCFHTCGLEREKHCLPHGGDPVLLQINGVPRVQ